jgi:hypothetical protein
MISGDGTHFSENDVGKLISGSQQVEIVICLHFCFLFVCVYYCGLTPRMGATHRRERKIPFVLPVLSPFVFIYWHDFFGLTCLSFYVWSLSTSPHWLNDAIDAKRDRINKSIHKIQHPIRALSH